MLRSVVLPDLAYCCTDTDFKPIFGEIPLKVHFSLDQALSWSVKVALDLVTLWLLGDPCSICSPQVVNGLMERDDWEEAIQTPLGILPGGSGNALAASVHHYTK